MVDLYTKSVLTLIAVLLGVLAVQNTSYVHADAAQDVRIVDVGYGVNPPLPVTVVKSN